MIHLCLVWCNCIFFYLIFFLIVLGLSSCKPNEDEVIASAEKVVLRFVDEVKLQNFTSAE